MKIQEVHVVFNYLGGTTELIRSNSLDGMKRPDQPHKVALTRLIFEGGYMFQVDDELIVIQKDNFKITYRNDEPDNLVIHDDCKNPEPAGFDGDVMTLLSEYKAPISCEDLSKMRTEYTRLMLTLS